MKKLFKVPRYSKNELRKKRPTKDFTKDTRDKINRIKEKNGIDTFGANFDDLLCFEICELKELLNAGLITEMALHSQILFRENDESHGDFFRKLTNTI